MSILSRSSFHKGLSTVAGCARLNQQPNNSHIDAVRGAVAACRGKQIRRIPCYLITMENYFQMMGNARLLPMAQTTYQPGTGVALTVTLPSGGIDGSPWSSSAAGMNADGTLLKLLSFDQLLQRCHRHPRKLPNHKPRFSQGFGKLHVLQAAKDDFPLSAGSRP